MSTTRKPGLALCAALFTLAAGCGSGGNNSTGAAGSGGGAAGQAGGGGASGSAGGGGAGGSAGAAGSGTDGGPGGGGTGGTTTCNTSPGKALRFSGTMIDLMTGDLGADLPGGDVPRTIEVWVKYLGAQSWTAEHTIMETGKAMGGQNRVLGLDNSGYTAATMIAQFGPYTNGYSDNNNPNGVFVPNIPQMGWVHLGWSYTGNHGTLTFTVNGTMYPITTQAGTPTLNLFPGIVTLGASQNFGTQGFDGLLDEVKIWSVAKTAAEMAADMNVVLKGTEQGLVAYYRLDEGSGTVANDVTGNAAHRLSVCTATSASCPAANQANPMWVDSDLPGPLTCAP